MQKGEGMDCRPKMELTRGRQCGSATWLRAISPEAPRPSVTGKDHPPEANYCGITTRKINES